MIAAGVQAPSSRVAGRRSRPARRRCGPGPALGRQLRFSQSVRMRCYQPIVHSVIAPLPPPPPAACCRCRAQRAQKAGCAATQLQDHTAVTLRCSLPPVLPSAASLAVPACPLGICHDGSGAARRGAHAELERWRSGPKRAWLASLLFCALKVKRQPQSTAHALHRAPGPLAPSWVARRAAPSGRTAANRVVARRSREDWPPCLGSGRRSTKSQPTRAPPGSCPSSQHWRVRPDWSGARSRCAGTGRGEEWPQAWRRQP